MFKKKILTVGFGFPFTMQVKCASLLSPEWTLLVDNSISGGSATIHIISYNYWLTILSQGGLQPFILLVTNWLTILSQEDLQPFILSVTTIGWQFYLRRICNHSYYQLQLWVDNYISGGSATILTISYNYWLTILFLNDHLFTNITWYFP